ncbi:hypothetical protein JL720_305 [Aureococcus anophagefferens]|nr:hypothetical protein JL720_305 [Aureococcus anophagefferens]
MARVVAALDGGDSLDNEIYAQKCAAALEALEAELADQDRRFATIRETLSLTAESLEALSGAEDATLPPDVLARLDEDRRPRGRGVARSEAAVDDLIAAARAEAAVAGVGGLELEDDDGGARGGAPAALELVFDGPWASARERRAAGAAGRDSPFNAAGALGGVLTTCLPAGPSLL